LLAGAIEQNVGFGELLSDPSRILAGFPFSVTLIAILGIHEFGHYAVGRHHGMPVSLPFFIPVPPVPPFLLGTLGAVIRLRGAIRDRRALFDMAVAGPLAGLVIAIPAYALGIAWSRVVPLAELAERPGELVLGPSLLPVLLHRLVLGPMPPDGGGITLHPIATAAWFGFFVTALNLIPAGQLDGGHIVYAIFGRRHALISKLAVGALVLIGLRACLRQHQLAGVGRAHRRADGLPAQPDHGRHHAARRPTPAAGPVRPGAASIAPAPGATPSELSVVPAVWWCSTRLR
jgi:membrane-associated protease RseP (regulator of RpoE activity)